MIPKHKKISFLQELRDNPKKYYTPNWAYICYEFFKEEISEVNDYIQSLSQKGYLHGNIALLELTEKGHELLKRYEHDLFYKGDISW